MSGTEWVINRAKMSAGERRTRSQLAQLFSQRGVMQGTLLERRRVCGTPNCKCTRGEGHDSLYLVISEGGRTRQLYIPKEWESRVRQWVADYHQVRELTKTLSRLYWDKVRQRKD